ncbi:MAG TPA: hypothetical protein PLV25_01385, partial [Opitutales bacterium]|nr:hypothetical protein [Opitutales bacterium]
MQWRMFISLLFASGLCVILQAQPQPVNEAPAEPVAQQLLSDFVPADIIIDGVLPLEMWSYVLSFLVEPGYLARAQLSCRGL